MMIAHQNQQSKNHQPLSNAMSILGFLNGMLGGTILVLPLLGIQTGYVMIILVCTILGFISSYTGQLIVLHLGQAKDMKTSILNHFNQDQKYTTLYSFLIWLAFVPAIFIYYKLICLQVQGLLGYHTEWIGPTIIVSLGFAVIYVRIRGIGQEIIAYGIISIIVYITFLIWAQFSAPSGPHKMQPIGPPLKLISAMMMAFNIHNFLPQNILKNPNKKEYRKIIRYTFLFGVIIYIFITFGSFALVNRVSLKHIPQTINDYFPSGGWQITVIQVLFLVHLFSTLPNFIIVSKINFFQIFKVQSEQKLSFKEVAYFLFFLMLAQIVYAFNVQLQILIIINGTFQRPICQILIPIWVHLKCVFYDKSSGCIKGNTERNNQIQSNECHCDNTYASEWTFYLQNIFLVIILILGIVFMFYTFYTMLHKSK